MHQALQWLVTHNIYYPANQIGINQDTLAQHPHDGNLSNVSTVTMPCPSLSEEGITPEQGDESNNVHLTQSFVPTATRSMTEQEAARQSVCVRTGRVYVRQHPGDAQLSLDELRDMVGRQGEAFSNRVLHYASSLRRTKQY